MSRKMIHSMFLAVLLVLGAPLAAWAATSAEIAEQVRADWTKAKRAYLAAVKPYEADPVHGPLVTEYTATLNETGKLLEKFIALRLASPPPDPATVTPVVDKLIKNLGRLRTLQGKASGNMVTVLGTALSQQSQVTQNALKNMR